MAFADAMLLSDGGGATAAPAPEKPKAANVLTADLFTPRTANRTGPYHRSCQALQVISSTRLEEVNDETGQNPSTGSAPPARPGARWPRDRHDPDLISTDDMTRGGLRGRRFQD